MGNIIKNKIKLSSLQIIFFLSLLISLSRILPPQPWTTPSKELLGVGWLESPKSCCWTSNWPHHGDDVCGDFGSCQDQIDRVGGEIAKARMAKDVKVVENIKPSVLSFLDICANGHLLR